MNKKLFKIAALILITALLLCGCSNNKNASQTVDPVVNTAWVSKDDGSYMVFNSDGTYAWYQNKEVKNDNYFAGKYNFYIGSGAMDYLTEDLKDYGITKSELEDIFRKNKEYNLDNLICFTADNSSFMLNGQEQLKENKAVSYFGFMLLDGTYMDIANMTTGSYYGFSKE